MVDELDTKDMIRVLSVGRIAIGAGAFLAPRRFGRSWTGAPSTDVVSGMAVRSLGARDVALGVGTLVALENDAPVHVWLEAQALADASDVVSTLAAFGQMGRFRRWAMLATAAGACYMGVKLAAEIDR